MTDFNIRSDSIDVELIMEQIRSRIREKRGVDYTEQQIHDLAAVKLEKFLDPRGVRSDLAEEFRRMRQAGDMLPRPNYEFNDETLFETHRAPIRLIRRLLRPILKLFFNPNPLIQALHIQSQLNTLEANSSRRPREQLTFEVIHNLVLEVTRIGIEMKNLKMRVESLSSRLEFNERRARSLESAVVYKPAAEQAQPVDRGVRLSSAGSAGAGRQELAEARPVEVRPGPAPTTPSGAQPPVGPEGPGQRSRRRRRRRGRRGGPPAAVAMGASGPPPPGQTNGQGPGGDITERSAVPAAPPSEPSVSGPASSGSDPDAQ